MVRVKGTKISSKLDYVRAAYGDEAEEKERALLEALAADDRQQVRSTLEIGWYPQELYERVVDALVDGVAGGDERVLDLVGAHTAERQAAGAYKVYYRSKDPTAVLEAMAPMHGMLNDPGEMAVEPRGNGHVTLVVRKPQGSTRTCRIARAFYRRSVELCGVSDVTVRETECSGRGAPACRFEVRWK